MAVRLAIFPYWKSALSRHDLTAPNDSTCTGRLSEICAEIDSADLDIEDESATVLAEYARRLWEWNQRLNLTRHDDARKLVQRDLVDVTELSSLIESGESVLDVGSGGGVPAVPLAILRPDVSVTACESVAKKAAALTQIALDLADNLEVVHARGEECLAEGYFDVVIARGLAPLVKIARWFQPHWSNIGRMLLIKGPAWVEERKAARDSGYLRGVELRKERMYAREGMDAESVVLRLWASENG